jgi:predicted signal transduction protein with EAL and GGDEF domain
VLARVRVATPDGASCSTGVALWDELEGAMDLFARADAALYEGKRDGGDQTVLFSREPSAIDSGERPAERTPTG